LDIAYFSNTAKFKKMKTFVAFLTLPVVIVLYYIASKLYVVEQYFAAYALLVTALGSLVFSIQTLGQLFEKKPGIVVPAVPRAYLTKAKVA